MTATVVASASALASASASTAVEWVTFTSERYGYAIDHPADWEVVSKDGTPTLETLNMRSGGSDTIGTAYSHLTNTFDGNVVLAAFDLGDGSTLEDFTDSTARGACGSGYRGTSEFSLGGEPARSKKCSWGEAYWVQVTAVHGSRGYVVWLISNIKSSEPLAPDRPINDRFLASFRFTD